MRIKTIHREPGTRFTPAAADAQIGRTVPVDVNGTATGQGTVLAAKVLEDGAALELTVEVTGEAGDALTQAFTPQLKPWSIGG